jgi:hypothetical protein
MTLEFMLKRHKIMATFSETQIVLMLLCLSQTELVKYLSEQKKKNPKKICGEKLNTKLYVQYRFSTNLTAFEITKQGLLRYVYIAENQQRLSEQTRILLKYLIFHNT